MQQIEEVGDCLNKEDYDDANGTTGGAGKKYLDPRVCNSRGRPKAKRAMSLAEMVRRGKSKKKRSCQSNKQQLVLNQSTPNIMVRKLIVRKMLKNVKQTHY